MIHKFTVTTQVPLLRNYETHEMREILSMQAGSLHDPFVVFACFVVAPVFRT